MTESERNKEKRIPKKDVEKGSTRSGSNSTKDNDSYQRRKKCFTDALFSSKNNRNESFYYYYYFIVIL